MSAPQGLVSFTGVDTLLEASLTFGHGISPSAAILTMAPQVNFAVESGTLAFEFDGTAISLRDCKVDYASVERNRRGEVWRVTVLDRRWRWRYGRISGSYNARRDDASLADGEAQSFDTERTPQELAALCLDAMGESDYEIGDLPDDTRPRVEWDGELPAEALASLCDQLGCCVVLELGDRVAIRRIGTGAELPSGYFLEDSITRDTPPRPSELAVVCGPSRYQVDFQLEAVGLEEGDAESADTLVPIDDLSYRPAAGWSHVDLPYFHEVERRFRGLAVRSVFRYYRIKTPLTVPGYEGSSAGQIEKLEQILPIEDEQVWLALENGRLANRPATIHGVWFPNSGTMANSTSSLVPAPQSTEGDGGGALPMFYQGRYRLDTARGLVIFDQPVYRNQHPSAGGGSGYELEIAPAQLVLRAACRVRDPEMLAFNAYVRRRPTGASGGGTRYLRHDELVLTHTPQYSANYSVASVDTNLASLNEAIDALLDVALAAYDEVEPRMARYARLVAIDLDGAIRQITYQVGPEGATTTVERNTERPGLASTFLARREIERTRATNAAVARLQPDNLAKCLQSNLRTKPRS